MSDNPTDNEPTEAPVPEGEEAATDTVSEPNSVADTEGEGSRERDTRNLGAILDVGLHVSVELGRTRMTISDLLRLSQGSIIELDKIAGAPLDFYINDKHVAHGEAVILNEQFGVRIQEIVSLKDRVQSLK